MRLSIYLFFCFSFSFSQNQLADSLKQILSSRNITTEKQIEILNKLTLYYGEFDFDQATELNNKIIVISKKNNYFKGYGFYFQNLANYNMISGDFALAEHNAKKAQFYFRKAKDLNNHILSVYTTCFALDLQGKSKIAEELALKTIKKYENNPKANSLVELYYYISTLYNENYKPKTAFYYINKAANLYRKSNNQNGLFKCNYQLANICYFNGMYEKSISYLNQYYLITDPVVKSKLEFKIKIHYLYTNNYLELKHYNKALFHCEAFYKIAKKEEILPIIKNGTFLLAEIYSKLNNKTKANYYLKKIETQTNTPNEQYQINYIKEIFYFNQKKFNNSLYHGLLNYKTDPNDKDNLRLLAYTYFELENYKKAYKYLQNYLEISVDELKKDKDNQIADYESLYRLKEKDYIIKKNMLDAAKKDIIYKQQKLLTSLFLIITIVLLIFFIFIIISYKNSKKKKKLLAQANLSLQENNKLLKELNIEKEIILKEIHHRVKNNLQLVMSLLNIQSQDIQNISINDFLEKGRSRIATISLIHQNLYQNENFAKINFQEYLENLVDNIKNSFSKNTIDIEINTHNNSFNIDTAIPLGLIINEIVCNAFKHAFPNEQKGKIEIEISKQSNNTYLLQIGDNGIGYNKDKKKNNSIGLELVSLLILQLKGKFKKINKLGTNYCIEFKNAL